MHAHVLSKKTYLEGLYSWRPGPDGPGGQELDQPARVVTFLFYLHKYIFTHGQKNRVNQKKTTIPDSPLLLLCRLSAAEGVELVEDGEVLVAERQSRPRGCCRS